MLSLQIESTNGAIDRFVYELPSLEMITEEEIKFVEE